MKSLLNYPTNKKTIPPSFAWCQLVEILDMKHKSRTPVSEITRFIYSKAVEDKWHNQDTFQR